MRYYFEDIEKQKQVKKILESWVDTPWRHRCGVKGLGVDCIHFVARVLEEMGILRWRKDLIPDYPRDWHLHNTRELLCEAIERELKVERLVLENPMNGDIVCSHFGQASSHAGIYFDGYVYQSIDEVGVRKINVRHKLPNEKSRFVYRILT